MDVVSKFYEATHDFQVGSVLFERPLIFLFLLTNDRSVQRGLRSISGMEETHGSGTFRFFYQ